MRTYGRVSAAFWTDEKTVALSSNGKVLALYILTGPHSNGIGCYRLPMGYIADDLKWEPGTVTETLSELLASGFVKRCETTSWLFIPKFLTHNTPENPNVGIALSKLIALVPTKCSFYQEFVASLQPHAKRFPEGFVERLPKGMPNKEPSPSPSPEPSPEPNPSSSKASKPKPAEPLPRADDPALEGEDFPLLWLGDESSADRQLGWLGAIVDELPERDRKPVTDFTRMAVAGKPLSEAQAGLLETLFQRHKAAIVAESNRRIGRRFPGLDAAAAHPVHGKAINRAMAARDDAEIDRLRKLIAEDAPGFAARVPASTLASTLPARTTDDPAAIAARYAEIEANRRRTA